MHQPKSRLWSHILRDSNKWVKKSIGIQNTSDFSTYNFISQQFYIGFHSVLLMLAQFNSSYVYVRFNCRVYILNYRKMFEFGLAQVR